MANHKFPSFSWFIPNIVLCDKPSFYPTCLKRISFTSLAYPRQANDVIQKTNKSRNKYDGYNFTVYRHQYKKANSIANDITRCIVVDDDNRIWIGTRDGLSLYYHRKWQTTNSLLYLDLSQILYYVTNPLSIQRAWNVSRLHH